MINFELFQSDPQQPGAAFDYTLPQLPPSGAIELVFNVEDTRIGVPIDIFDDNLLEPSMEQFALRLTIPANPPVGQINGDITRVVVTITDNEGKYTSIMNRPCGLLILFCL